MRLFDDSTFAASYNMLAGVKFVDKAAAEKALKQEEKALKEEKKQLKKAMHTWQCDGTMT